MLGCSLSPAAPSVCERVWHRAVFIYFEGCLCMILSLTAFFLSICSRAWLCFCKKIIQICSNAAVSLVFPVCICFLSFVVALLYKRFSTETSPATLCCTLDIGELKIDSILWAFFLFHCLPGHLFEHTVCRWDHFPGLHHLLLFVVVSNIDIVH